MTMTSFAALVVSTAAVLLLVAAALPSSSFSFVDAASCMHPPPAANFNISSYQGLWYEIGKIQTKGGAYFEKDCVCTSISIQVDNFTSGDSTALNSCRKLAPSGEYLNATGSLTQQNPPGKWKEGFSFGIIETKVDYTVIMIGDDYAVEYDCGDTLGLVNYCIHIMSRTPTMNATLFNSLVEKSVGMGLNPEGIDLHVTLQDGCW